MLYSKHPYAIFLFYPYFTDACDRVVYTCFGTVWPFWCWCTIKPPINFDITHIRIPCWLSRPSPRCGQGVHESSLPVAHPGYQVLSDILFRLSLIANCFHTVQYSDCSDLNWRYNHYHLFWHCMNLLVLMCCQTVIPPQPASVRATSRSNKISHC